MVVASGQMLDRYRLVREIGSGSFGSVWLAEDTWLNKNVALKIPHEKAEDLTKFLAEPKLLAGLEHPNIIKLLTVGRFEEDVFMVMEYVEGRSLKEILKGGRIEKGTALGIARAILDALSHAHGKGIVHRDLKPGNILVTEGGQVKITDFGTAHALEKGDSTVAAGTLYYMPKEQLLGRVTPASDIYSLGVMLFEMLTGTLPFKEAEGNALIQRILSPEEAPSAAVLNPEVDAELAEIVARGVRKDPAKRWKSAGEFMRAIDDYLAGKRVEPEAPEPKPQHPVYDKLSRRAPRLSDSLSRTHEFVFRKSAGGRGRSEGQFMLPSAAAVDAEGNLYVADAVKSNIQVFDREFRVIRTIGEEGGVLDDGLRFLSPSAMTVDGKGNVYVCDTKNSRVQILDPQGNLTRKFGRALIVVGLHEEKGVIGLNYPRGLAVDEEEGIIFVADSGNHRLRSFSTEGKAVQIVGGRGDRPGEFDVPMGLAMGPNGMLYVVDSQNYRIQVFDRWFRYLNSIGKRGTERGCFYQPPLYACVNMFDEVIVTDGSDKLHVFKGDGDFIGNVEPAKQSEGATVRYHSAAFRGSEDLYLVNEGTSEVEHMLLRERDK